MGLAFKQLGQLAEVRMLDVLVSTGKEEWVYYGLSALFFVLCGLACGYFIWRKGHMQMLDAELEVQRTDDELNAAQKDLSLEEQELISPPSSVDG